jgi:hypothetical protein
VALVAYITRHIDRSSTRAVFAGTDVGLVRTVLGLAAVHVGV